MCVNVGDLSIYGSGYPLYFKLTKYYALIILIVFLLSGSLTYLLNDMMCESKCVYFFGIKVFDLGKVDNFIQKQTVLIVLIATIIITSILYIKPKIFKDIKKYNEKHKSPASYTVMVQNLPTNMTSEEIRQYFMRTCKIYKQFLLRKYKVMQSDLIIGKHMNHTPHFHSSQILISDPNQKNVRNHHPYNQPPQISDFLHQSDSSLHKKLHENALPQEDDEYMQVKIPPSSYPNQSNRRSHDAQRYPAQDSLQDPDSKSFSKPNGAPRFNT